MKLLPLSKISVFCVAVVSSAFGALADAPDRKNAVSGQEILQIYGGKTWIWSKGGSYWAPNGQFEAYFGDAVGVGKWYATNKGSLCYDATWKDKAGGGTESIKRCWRHATDSKGVLWKQDSENKTWYRPQQEINEKVKQGNLIKSEVMNMRKKVGLQAI